MNHDSGPNEHGPNEPSPNEPSGVGSTQLGLLARARRNEPEAWNRLVVLYTPLVALWCRSSRLPPEDQRDLVQETFQAAAANLGRFRKEGPHDTFRGWLRTITTNKVRDRFRRRGREPRAVGGTEMVAWLGQQPQPVESEPAAEAFAFAEVLTAALAQIRGHFREATWQAFWRTAVDGRPPTDVGEELGMTGGAVRVAKTRVLQRLREELGDAFE